MKLLQSDVYLDEGDNFLTTSISPTIPPSIDYSGDREWCAYRFYHQIPANFVVTKTKGKIGNLLVSLTKAGLAGVEATIHITTGNEAGPKECVYAEVLGWWQYGEYRTGLVIYDYNYWPDIHKGSWYKKINPNDLLDYEVVVVPGVGITTKIYDEGGSLIFEKTYNCNAKRIITLQTELEYWRYYSTIGEQRIPRDGHFNFYGEVIFDKIYRDGVGWTNADICTFFLDIAGSDICDPALVLSYDHYSQGGSWILKGSVSDTVGITSSGNGTIEGSIYEGKIAGVQLIVQKSPICIAGQNRCFGHHLYKCTDGVATLIKENAPECMNGNPGDWVVYTDGNGRFRVDGLPVPATYTVYIYKEGWYCWGDDRNKMTVKLTESQPYQNIILHCSQTKPNWW